jgi:hypothetical protein
MSSDASKNSKRKSLGESEGERERANEFKEGYKAFYAAKGDGDQVEKKAIPEPEPKKCEYRRIGSLEGKKILPQQVPANRTEVFFCPRGIIFAKVCPGVGSKIVCRLRLKRLRCIRPSRGDSS